jgi:hypothetical protein
MLVWIALKTNVNLNVAQSDPASFLNFSNAKFFLTFVFCKFVLSAIQTSIFQLNEEVDTFLKVVDIACFCLSFLIESGDQYVDGKEVLLKHQPNFVPASFLNFSNAKFFLTLVFRKL